MSTTADATSVYIKVAQYFVDKKLKELRKKKFHLKDEHIGEGLQSDSPQYSWNEWRKGLPLPRKLPQYSWDELLERRKCLPLSRRPTRVAIVGAGVAGLRTAMLLRKREIPYKIFEASHSPGGRVLTYSFRSDPDTSPEGKHDYLRCRRHALPQQ
jgi:NAD(P)-binding Rossmann-like domain